MSEFNVTKDEANEDDMYALVETQSQHTGRRSGEAILTITNNKNGHRNAVADKVIERIKAKNVVHVAFYKLGIAIGATLPGIDNPFTLRKSGNKCMIYNRSLVEEITDRFELDFGAATTVSFYDVEYRDGIAYIPLRV